MGCPKFEARELASQVQADIERAETAQVLDSSLPTAGDSGETLQAATDVEATPAIARFLVTAITLGEAYLKLASAQTSEARNAAIPSQDDSDVSKALLPYYTGNGNIDHARFLADLEANKGAKLDEVELRIFGSVAGAWCGNKLFDEIALLPQSEQLGAVLSALLS
jgi:hypothetical protein